MQAPSNATFRALADPTRREILRMLRAGPRTSGEIASQFGSSWPTISRHLALLREPGLVVAERRGQEIYYELNTSVFQDLVQHLLGWIEPETTREDVSIRIIPGRQLAALVIGYLAGDSRAASTALMRTILRKAVSRHRLNADYPPRRIFDRRSPVPTGLLLVCPCAGRRKSPRHRPATA